MRFLDRVGFEGKEVMARRSCASGLLICGGWSRISLACVNLASLRSVVASWRRISCFSRGSVSCVRILVYSCSARLKRPRSKAFFAAMVCHCFSFWVMVVG